MRHYLFDTHTLLWYSQQNSLLPSSMLETLEQPDVSTYISRISLLEIAIKFGIGKLQLPDPLNIWFEKTAAAGFNMLEITDEHLVRMAALPMQPDHRDPFDRLLIAQALNEDFTLVSRDGKFVAYPGLKLRWA